MATYDVFISHKSQDKEQLTKIENFLEAKGISYWSDSKMVEGLNWMKQIERGIQESKIMLYLLSQNVIDDPDNIEAEINLATQRRMDFVVVKLDDSLMADYTGAFNLYLKKVQWIDANNNINNIYDSLYTAIKRLTSSSTSEKKEYDARLEVELARLQKKQEDEYRQKITDEIKHSFLMMNAQTVNSYLNQGKFTHALNKVNELLLTDTNWEFLELKLKCLTRNYKDFSNDYIDQVLKDIKDYGCPDDEYERILKEMDSTHQKAVLAKQENAKRVQIQKNQQTGVLIEKKISEYERIKEEIHKDNVFRLLKFCSVFFICLIFYNLILNEINNSFMIITFILLCLLGCYCKNGFISFIGYTSMFIGLLFVLFIGDGIVLAECRASLIDDLIISLADLFGLSIDVSNGISNTYLSLFMTILMFPYLLFNYISIIKKDKKVSSYISSIIVSIIMTILFFIVYYLAKGMITDASNFILSAIIIGIFTIFSKNLLHRGSWKKNDQFRKDYCRRLKIEIERASKERNVSYDS